MPELTSRFLAEAIDDAGDLALIFEGRAKVAALQFRLLLVRVQSGFPAGRDSIANLIGLAGQIEDSLAANDD
jgi:hypothetical protein